jgi:hypothetical protein
MKRRFGFLICILKSDNERAVFGLKELSDYELWARELGIEIELAPVLTKEPNGFIERAGQEVVVKSIAKRIAAGLPAELWPGVLEASVWLYNRSPRASNGMVAPNEALEGWFTNFFRWYPVEFVRHSTADLSPN